MALKRIPIPVDITLAENGTRLEFTWTDGRVTRFAARDLRFGCPCAGCVDEMSGKRTLRLEDVDPGVHAVSYARVGRYAVQVHWSDGHSTGMYTYERLREEPSRD